MTPKYAYDDYLLLGFFTIVGAVLGVFLFPVWLLGRGLAWVFPVLADRFFANTDRQED